MNIDYGTLKAVHVGAVYLSVAFFVTRGAWRAWAPAMLERRWVRVWPHAVDTVLLASALWLAWRLPSGTPHAWLGAKVAGLVVYIVLGTIALKRGRTPAARAAAFVAALATIGYVVSVALTKSPLGFFAGLGLR